jgi:hypothetical protein
VRAISLLLLVACGRSNFHACPADAPAAADDSLVLHLAFDSDGFLLDRSGGNDGGCSGCPLQVGGQIGDGAAAFDGMMCIQVPDALELRPNTFTYAVWAAPTGPMSTLLARPFTSATTNQDSYGISIDTNFAWEIYMVDTAVTGPVQPNWHHYAGVYDGATLTAYVDGVAFGTPQAAPAPRYAIDPIAVGCDIDMGLEAYRYRGSLDDVRLYDRALDADEVAELVAMQ